MRDKSITKNFYLKVLEFMELVDHGDYLMIKKDSVEIHFFEFRSLDPKENDGQVYIRTDDIGNLYQFLPDAKLAIHPSDPLGMKPWGQKGFSILDPDHNLLTFGQST